MASTSSPPGSPGPPSAPSDDISSSSSSSASPPRSFLFRRHRRPRLPTPPPSPAKKPRVSPKPRLIGPLSFSDFFQEEFTPVMTELFITLGVLHYVAKHSSLQTYEILTSLEYITDQCADEVPSFCSTSDSQYTLSLALIELVPPDLSRQDLHPRLDDVWECTIGPCSQLEDVLKNGQVKLSDAALKITEIQSKSRDIVLLRTYPQMARKLEQAAHSFEVMYRVVHRQIELEIEESQKDIADALLDLAGNI